MSYAFNFYHGVMAQTIPTVLTQGVQTAVILKLGLKNILTFSYSSFPFLKITTKKLKILKN